MENLNSKEKLVLAYAIYSRICEVDRLIESAKALRMSGIVADYIDEKRILEKLHHGVMF